MAGKLGSKHRITGRERFFKYKKARVAFLDQTNLTEDQLLSLDQFFLGNDKFKPWHIDMIITMINQGFLDLKERYESTTSASPRSLKYFTSLWGETEGYRRHLQVANQAKANLITTHEYWVSRGLERDQNAIDQHNKKGLDKCHERIKGSSDCSIRSTGHWIKKGHNQKDATEIVKRIQTQNGIEWYESRYGDSGKEMFEARIQTWKTKLKQTMIDQGLWTSDQDLEAIQIYYRDVSRFTEQSYKQHFGLINPENLPRDGKSFELDHKYSKMCGFRDEIPAEVIGHWTNLAMLPAAANNSKWTNCSISKDQLLEDYRRNR